MTMHFRGQQVLDALLDKLKQPAYGLGTAKQVLLTGCSAGGMSVYLHADYVATQVANPNLKKYKAAALSGFFLDHPTSVGDQVTDEHYRYTFAMQNMSGGVNQRCIMSHSDSHATCSTPQVNYEFVRSPFFVLNSMLDNYQMKDILQVGCNKVEDCNTTQVRFQLTI